MSVAGRSPHRLRSRVSLAFLLVPPLAWLVVAYLGSLAVLLVSSFWSTDTFTGAVVRSYTSDNIVRVLTGPVFRTATLRTVGIALAVTVISGADYFFGLRRRIDEQQRAAKTTTAG